MSKFIIQTRKEFYPQTTISSLDLGTGHFCWVLEDTVRPYGIKVPKFTAIPFNVQGYHLRMRFSPTFKREMLMLYTPLPDVRTDDTIRLAGTSFRYVYAHGGQNHEDTDACLIIAFNRDENIVQGSAEVELNNIIKSWWDYGEDVYWIIK